MKWKAQSTAQKCATFFLDRSELVYAFSISVKQTSSNCSFKLNIKLTNEISQNLDRFSKVLKTIFWWLSSLSFTASSAKEKNNMQLDISYSCKSESGEESEQTPLALICLIWSCTCITVPENPLMISKKNRGKLFSAFLIQWSHMTENEGYCDCLYEVITFHGSPLQNTIWHTTDEGSVSAKYIFLVPIDRPFKNSLERFFTVCPKNMYLLISTGSCGACWVKN